MKRRKVLNYISSLAVAAGLPLGLSTAHAGLLGGPMMAQINIQVPGVHVEWGEDRRKKLRHAYWILAQSDRDYHGHREAAMEEVRKAAHVLGVELEHGEGYGGDHFHWSDERMKEARSLLEDVAGDSGGREHEHLREAIHEINRGLEEHHD